MSTLVRRQEVTQATLDEFRDQPLKWGEFDCGQLIIRHLARFGIDAGGERFGRYNTAKGSMKAMKRAGFDDLEQVMDGLFPAGRIPASRVLTGDVLGFRIPGEQTSLAVALGNGRVLGLHLDTGGFIVVQPDYNAAVSMAWRVL